MRVLMLGPWPVNRPRHGGQIRAASIINAYRERGHDVRFIGIFDPNNVSRSDIGPDDIAIDEVVMAYIARSGQSWEISLWNAFAEVPELLGRFESVVRNFRPEVVQFEEPYLWPVIRILRQRGHFGSARLIHSSYNFESAYRPDLMKIEGKVDRTVVAHVVTQETEIAREADLVVTVSDADAASFRRIGARRVLVAVNGGRPPQPTQEALDAVDAYLGEIPFALFVSSAHPPNAQGLLDLASLSPTQIARSAHPRWNYLQITGAEPQDLQVDP